jgi:hypothetical protein
MVLKAKIANHLKTDNEGYTTADITSIQYIDKEESNFENGQDQIEFTFTTAGTLGTVDMKVWTGTTLNFEPYLEGKTEKFNKFTVLATKLELITIKAIEVLQKEGKQPDIDVESLIGASVRFKTVKSAKSKGLSNIVLESLELVK